MAVYREPITDGEGLVHHWRVTLCRPIVWSDLLLWLRACLSGVGLDYSIWLACGLGSSLGDLLGCLPARALPARLPDGAGSA